jgi:hypothetical protein
MPGGANRRTTRPIPNLRNRPTGFALPVRGLVPSAGAGFVVALRGEMQQSPRRCLRSVRDDRRVRQRPNPALRILSVRSRCAAAGGRPRASPLANVGTLGSAVCAAWSTVPPAPGLLALDALVAATPFRLPIQSSRLALEGACDLLETIEGVAARG